MKKAEFIGKYRPRQTKSDWDEFESDLDELLKETIENAYLNYGKNDIEICGKCGTVI